MEDPIPRPFETDLTVTLDGPVDTGTVDSATFVVHGGNHAPVPGVFSFGTNDFTFNPDDDFFPGERVQATVTDGIESSGLPVAPYVWWFRTAVEAGSGIFSDSGQELGSGYSTWVSLGDVDRDGDLDAIVANYSGQGNRVWINNGDGDYADSGQSLGTGNSRCVSLCDVDGDGDLDAFVANYYGQGNTVWMNENSVVSVSPPGGSHSAPVETDLTVTLNGAVNMGTVNSSTFVVHGGNHAPVPGAFSSETNDFTFNPHNEFFPGELVQATVTNGIECGGNPLIAPYVWWFRTAVESGAGIFSDSGQSLENGYSAWVSLGDVDGDGDLDAFVANFSQANKVWLNQNPATPSPTVTPTGTPTDTPTNTPTNTPSSTPSGTPTGPTPTPLPVPATNPAGIVFLFLVLSGIMGLNFLRRKHH